MKNSDDKKKQQYEKPVVLRFPLRPEEAVLGFCKHNAGTGPSIGSCHDPFAGNCTQPGS